MKKIVIALLSLCCMACNDEIEVRRTIDSNLLIPKSGLQTVTYAADQTTVTYEVAVYRSGYNDGTSKASLQVDEAALTSYNQKMKTEYRLLPVDCYSKPDAGIVLTNGSFMQNVVITFRTGSIPQGDYVLPLTLKSEDGTPVTEDYKTVLIALQKAPEETPDK